MSTGVVQVDGDNIERLGGWLSGDHRGEGAAEELDWLVGQARQGLTEADDAAGLIELAGRLGEWAGENDDDPMASVALLHACRLCEDAGDTDAACDYAERAMARNPSDPTAMTRLDRLLSQTGDLARLEAARTSQVELLAERAPLEHSMRVEALRALAVLRAEALHDLDSAIDAYQQSIEIEAIDSTMEALAELHLRRDHPGDADEAAEIYFQLAERADPEAARPLLEQALDVQPDHEGALRALQQLSELSDEDDPRLVSRLVAFASVAPASPQRDSVIEELKRRNSDVSELEAAMGESHPPGEARAPAAPAAPVSSHAVEPSSAPGALAASLAASGGAESAVTSTLSYASSAAPRPDAGVARAGTGPSPALAGATAGGTLPLHAPAQAPPTAAPTRVFESVAPPRPATRWLGWAGGAGLLLLALWGLWAIGDGSPGAESPEASAGAPSAAEPPRARPAVDEGSPASIEPRPRADSPEHARAAPEPKPKRARRAAKKPRARRAKVKARVIGGVALAPALLRVRGGDIDSRALYARLEPVQRALARCYRTLRRRAPKARGLVEFGWTVSPAGRALDVTDVSGSLQARTVRLCGIRALRAARFPQPDGGAAKVRAVFDFAPPGR